jgi:hypothetical protein
MKKVTKDVDTIRDGLLARLKTPGEKVENMINYICYLRKKYMPMSVRVKSNLKAMEKLKGIEDWDTIANFIRKNNHENYQEYMGSLQELRTNNSKIEYSETKIFQ